MITSLIPAAIVAIVIPLAILVLVRRLDLYASGSFAVVLIWMGAGAKPLADD